MNDKENHKAYSKKKKKKKPTSSNEIEKKNK